MSDKHSLSRGRKTWLRAMAKLCAFRRGWTLRRQSAEALDAGLKKDVGFETHKRPSPQSRRDELYEAIRKGRLPPV